MLSRCLLLILLLVCMTATFAEASFPQNQWVFVDSPESAGWSTQKPKLVGDYASIMGTLGMMVIQDGKVIYSYGDVEERSYLHSVRKSLLSGLIGIYVESGHIALSNTLASLGAETAIRPLRGSRAPDTYWYYNNWDFNVLGAIFKKQTNNTIGRAFFEKIAQPIGMQQFQPEDVSYQNHHFQLTRLIVSR